MKLYAPICAKCATPFVLRLPLIILNRERQWVFQPDCKCKPLAIDSGPAEAYPIDPGLIEVDA